jgi:hypothetical protein
MKRLLLLIPLCLSACIPAKPPIVQLNVTQIAVTQVNRIVITQIAVTAFTQIVATPQPSQTPWIITATPLPPTPTPQFSPTPTLSPMPTTPPTDIPSPLYDIHSPGFYLVNIDIAPGVWRSTVSGDGCYWAITTAKGDIINNHFGMAGGTINIPSTAFQVELGPECGDWIFLSTQ